MRGIIVLSVAAVFGGHAMGQPVAVDESAAWTGGVERARQRLSDFARNPENSLYQVKSSSNSGWTNTWRMAWAGCMTEAFLTKYKPTEWLVQIDSTVEPGEQSVCTAAVAMAPKNPASMPTQFYFSVQVSPLKFTHTEKTKSKHAFEESCVKEAFQQMVDQETGKAPRAAAPCSLN